MDFLSFGLNQKCTYWAVVGVDVYNEPSFAYPVVISCRWEDRVERMQNDEGEEFVSRSRIFLEDDLFTGGYIALGEHSESDPRNYPGAHRIMAVRTTPSLDGTFFERKCYL